MMDGEEADGGLGGCWGRGFEKECGSLKVPLYMEGPTATLHSHTEDPYHRLFLDLLIFSTAKNKRLVWSVSISETW